jgi:hypothetical protein
MMRRLSHQFGKVFLKPRWLAGPAWDAADVGKAKLLEGTANRHLIEIDIEAFLDVHRVAPIAEPIDERRYPVYRTAAHQTGATIIVLDSNESRRWISDYPDPGIFGIRFSSRVMEPALLPGDVVWFNPAIAPQVGDICMFEPANPETNLLRQVRHLDGETEHEWIVKAEAPREIRIYELRQAIQE